MPRQARPQSPLLTTEEAAAYLKLKPSTLEKARIYDQDGPPFATLFDSSVRYRIVDLDDWIAERIDRSVQARVARRRQNQKD